jgi:hypothetical protein
MNNDNHHPTDESTLRLVIRDEVSRLIKTHATTCTFHVDEHPKRLRTLETNYAKLVGIMIGSSTLGGAMGAAVIKYLT